MPTSPVGPPLCRFQSTHPARGATMAVKDCLQSPVLSIHAPREGCDGCPPSQDTSPQSISIHAPREGCDIRPAGSSSPASNFNPRTPRGVRLTVMTATPVIPKISIHAPREGCDAGRYRSILISRISIHAPREGCDGTVDVARPVSRVDFNPRTPRGVRR